MSLWTELKRRNVLRVVAAYVVIGWLVLQVADIAFNFLAIPDWVGKLLITLLVLGFIPVMAVAWVFELTPEGIQRESKLPTDHQNHVAARRLDYLTIGAVVILAMLTFYQVMVTPPKQAGTPEAVAEPASTTAETPAPGLMEATPTAAQLDAAAPPPNSIAVLPFANMSADPDNEYFSDGISEEILNQLARIRSLKVAARTSAFQFKGDNRNIGEIGELLNVRHVLEGSVRRAGDRVRITAQLINVDDGFHVWSDTFDRQMTDIFAIQDEIAGAIAEALEVTLSPDVGSKMELDVYDLVLRARTELGRRSAAGMTRAVEILLEATELQPDHPELWGQLALAQLLKSNWVDFSSEAQANTRKYAERALSLDPNNTAALVALAGWNMFAINLEEAETLYLRALESNPNSVDAVNWYGDFLTIVLRTDEAIRYETRAAQLDPLLAVHRLNLGFAYHVDGQPKAAAEEYRKAIELDPGFDPPLISLIRVMGQNGDAEGIRRLASSYEGPLADVVAAWTPIYEQIAEGNLAISKASRAATGDPQKVAVDTGDWIYVTAFLREREGGFPQFIWPVPFPTSPEILKDNPEYAEYWREPPRDRLLKARGHWIWEDDE